MSSDKWVEKYDPYEFEEFIAELWESKGYETKVRKGSNDRGIDIEATKENEKKLIQVKLYSADNKVGSQEVRMYATLYQQVPEADMVSIVTSSEFTKEAKKLGEDLDIELIDGEDISKIYERQGDESGNNATQESINKSNKNNSRNKKTSNSDVERLPSEVRSRINDKTKKFLNSESDVATYRTSYVSHLKTNKVGTVLVQQDSTGSNGRQVKSKMYLQNKIGKSKILPEPVLFDTLSISNGVIKNFNLIPRIGFEKERPIHVSLHDNSKLIDKIESNTNNRREVLISVNSEFIQDVIDAKIELVKDNLVERNEINDIIGGEINTSVDYTCPICSSDCYTGKYKKLNGAQSELRVCIYCHTVFIKEDENWVSKTIDL